MCDEFDDLINEILKKSNSNKSNNTNHVSNVSQHDDDPELDRDPHKDPPFDDDLER